jgi:hypothetical protein
MDAVFRGLNVYLGNYIGEFVGESRVERVLRARRVRGTVVRSAEPMVRHRRNRGWGIGWAAAFRNVTSVVAPVAEVNNYLLALWLIVLGVVLIRWRSNATATALPGRPAS